MHTTEAGRATGLPLLIVVIPYRNREANLAKLLPVLRAHLAPLPHRIVVAEQAGTELFNKGRLFNAAVDLHRSEDAYFCFHDVDMIPESPLCDYSLPTYPTLVAQHCSQFGYRLPYPGFFGGVTLLRKEHFIRVNGFSNEFWGWGCEDDDMMNRVRHHRLPVQRRAGRYACSWHESSVDRAAWQKNIARLCQNYGYGRDGLSSVAYTVLNTAAGSDCVRYLIDVGRPGARAWAREQQLARESVLRAIRRSRPTRLPSLASLAAKRSGRIVAADQANHHKPTRDVRWRSRPT